MPPFYDDPNASESRIWAGVTGRIVLALIIIAVIGGAATAIGFAVSTGTAPARGKAGAFRQQQSANNRVFQQANFEKLNADYLADLTTIKIDKAAVANATKANDIQLEGQTSVDLVGVQSHCAQIATTYNAQAHSYLAKAFMTADLPVSLDPNTCTQ